MLGSFVRLSASGHAYATGGFNLGPYLNIASAEVEAIVAALTHALDPPSPPPPRLTVFVDSQAAIGRLRAKGDDRAIAASRLGPGPETSRRHA